MKKLTKTEKIFNLQEKIIRLIYEEELQDLDFGCAYVNGSLSIVDLTQPEIVEAALKKIEENKEVESLQEKQEDI